MEMALSKICGNHGIKDLSKFDRGENHPNFKFLHQNGEFRVLRLYKSAETASKELRVLFKCSDFDFVPRIFSHSLQDPTYVITSFIDGIHLGDALKVADAKGQIEIARELGAALAKINSIPIADLNTFESLDFFEHIRKCLFEDGGAAAVGAEKANLVWKSVEDKRSVLVPFLSQQQLVHGDFKANNLLLRFENGNWALSGVIDWEFALSASPLYDVSTFYQHIERLVPDIAAKFLKEFLGAYSSKSPTELPENWEMICRHLNLIMHCDALVSSKPEHGRHKRAVEYLNKFIVALS